MNIGAQLENQALRKWEVLIRKILLCYIGNTIAAVGISLFINNGLGADPISGGLSGISTLLDVKYGTISFCHTGILILLALLIPRARRHIFAGTVINMLVLGPTINAIEPAITDFLHHFSTIPSKLFILILAQFVICVGFSLNMSARFGLAAIDAHLYAISDTLGKPFKSVKICADLLYVGIGLLLGGAIGAGTVLSALCTGPILTFFAKIWNQTLLKALKIQDIRNEFRKAPAN